ncbi:ArsR/SmtB family transcription factor [Amedibacillus sp. YH-ame10]
MADYRMQTQIIYECVSFIEQFVNHGEYFSGLERFCVNDQEKKTIQHLREVCKCIGETFMKKYADQVFLFTYINPEKCISPVKALLFGKLDFLGTDYKKQLQDFEAYYLESPIRILDEFLESEKGQPIEENMEMSQYMQAMNELLISDEVKWKLYSLQNEIPQICNVLNDMVECSISILEKHQDLYDEFLSVYREEIEQAKEKGFSESLTQAIGYYTTNEEIYLIPSVAACKTISFIDQKEGKECILYGIGAYRRICADANIRDEDICSTLKLISDKSKFDILRFIAQDKAYGAQIAQELKLSTPTISYHMQALLCAQLVTYEKSNNKLYYDLNKDYLRTFLQQVKERLLNE